MYDFFINIGVLAVLLLPVAVVLLIIGFAKKNPKIKKWSKYAFAGSGGLLLICIIGAMVSPQDKKEVVEQPKTEATNKKETKKEKKAETKKPIEKKKDTKTKEVKIDTSKSSEEKTKESSTPSSSEEPFDPASYPLVDFNAWNHDDVDYASKLQVTGTVIQAMKSNEGMNLRLAINDDYDQVVLITIEDSDYKDVIAEDDNVTVYGLNAGLTSYKTVMGNEQTIPAMLGTNYTVNSYGQ
ncbi:hypothetical protein [Streptococcus parauberis]|uniref:Conserved domain protein n=1 Tax=Streptococcus parauberis NCFD 2020 TaxID=873447 RepID=F1Z0Z2_9STRE|nr:hypothetical protein [Streptococcus parauberis]EGE55173.1 conserved domain protein [Streptococcus parauberis NCFD 2020]QBX18298.1 hypothetical protein Javan411_0002 [Streptococcus phage Javan411]QBX27649.1 hypothetical protein Javan400_0051 [Streptococcus phage Javan400]